MSLSSKLREFRKELRKGKKKAVYDDDQMRLLARNMPRDTDSLKEYLNAEQIKSFGNELLEITQAHTTRDQAKFEECILEMGAFVRGGLPGMELLNRVYPQIIKHFGVTADMEEVFEALKIYVNLNQNKIKRKWVKEEEDEDENPSQRMKFSQ
jgi:hypothetical protein